MNELDLLITIGRLRRKLEKRDKKIAGLLRRIADLEYTVATQSIDIQRLPLRISRSVQEALCNVRMIAINGVGKSDKIVEVRVIDGD